jgi:hypothetical protein
MKRTFVIIATLLVCCSCQNEVKRKELAGKIEDYYNFVDSLKEVEPYYLMLKENLVVYRHNVKRKQAVYALSYTDNRRDIEENKIKEFDTLYENIMREAALETERRYK